MLWLHWVRRKIWRCLLVEGRAAWLSSPSCLEFLHYRQRSWTMRSRSCSPPCTRPGPGMCTCPTWWSNRRSEYNCSTIYTTLLKLQEHCHINFRKLVKLEEEASIHVESIPSPPSTADPSITELFAQRTPTPPSIPAEFLKKLAEAEDLVNQLQRENASQREELAAIKHTVERDSRMKYKGCNHPVRTTRHRIGTSSKSLD